MRVAHAAGLTLLMIGCGAANIPGTQIEDTPENREVFDVVERYRMALVERDADRLRPIVSQKYYENGSTTDRQEDDYGYDRLTSSVLPKLRDNIKNVQYRIILRHVTIDGERAMAEYEYYYKFKYSEGGRERWVARNDFNRLDLVREDGVWKIASGL